LLPAITSTLEPTGTGAALTINTSSCPAALPFFATLIEPPIGDECVLAILAPKTIVVVEDGQVYVSLNEVPILPVVTDLNVFAISFLFLYKY
jgi:hypothetical protein